MMILTVLIVTIVLLAGLVYCLKDWKEDTPVPPEKLYAGQLNEYEIRINDELKLNDFESDVSYKYSNILHKIFVLFNIDENNETVVIANYENPCRFIKFSDIIGYNIVEDSYVTGGIGRAVAGGLIAGGVGAIVGANTANKKAVDSFYIATKYNDDTGSFEVFATGADALSIRNDEIDYIMCGGVECVRYLDNSTRCYINAVLGEELF